MTKACIAELQYAVDHRCRPDIDDIDAANILHEIDRLRAENEALQSALTQAELQSDSWQGRYYAIEAENEALRKDAERYRWIKEWNARSGLFTNPLDENIDAAMNK